MALLILGQEHLGWVLKKCMELKRVYLHKQQAKQLGNYINVQRNHTLSECSCTVRSVSEALAEPDL